MDWSPRISVRGRPRGWHRPMAMGMGYPGAPFVALSPAITVLAPSTGAVGTACTITGLYFGATQGSSFVTVNGVVATVDSWSNTSIAMHIPVGATTGPVIVTVGGLPSNGLTFTVTAGETYHYLVQPGGSNTGSTGPFATITYALQIATVALTGTGKTIAVRGATYNQAILGPAAAGTSWVNKVRVVNYASETVTLAPSSGDNVVNFNGTQRYLEFDGIHMIGPNSGATVYAGPTVNHIRYQNASINSPHGPGFSGQFLGDSSDGEYLNLDISGTGGPYAFYVGGNRNLIDRCHIHDVASTGIQIRSGAGTPQDNVVRNTIIHAIYTAAFLDNPADNRIRGITDMGNNSQLYNLLIYDIGFVGGSKIPTNNSAGVYIFSGSNCKVWNVTSIFNRIDGIQMDGPATATEVVNCIAYGNSGLTDTGATIVNYRDLGAATTQHHNSISGVNPQFVNVGANNYRLANGSPCINAGTPASFFTTDLDGAVRPASEGSPAWDQGAYERAL